MITPFKGIHYRNLPVYNALTLLKLRTDYFKRFKIAAGYIKQGDHVLDLCAGDGTLRDFLPANCGYECVEMSPSFSRILDRKSLKNHKLDLHKPLSLAGKKYDVAVMLISLCHFRETSMRALLEELKTAAARVVILEDVLNAKRDRSSVLQRFMNYLCSTDYYIPLELFTSEDFSSAMREHGYTVKKHTDRYYAGIFDNTPGQAGL